MTDILEPCPLCAGPSAVSDQHYRGTGASGMETPWPFIICNKCGLRSVPIKCNDSPYGQRTKAKSYKEARAEAIANWNERPQEERAKIVAYLRKTFGFDSEAADAIEAKEHLK